MVEYFLQGQVETICDRPELVFMGSVVNMWPMMEFTFRFQGKGNDANDF